MTQPSFRRLPLALALAAAGAALAAPPLAPAAAALPRYASREGATCVTCHVDPNGGGIRNEFGFAYLRNRHSVEPETRWANLTVDPKLNEWITLGLDMRVMYYASHLAGGPTLGNSTFFPMEGQVNVAVMPHEHLTLVASHGLVVDEPGFPAGYVARELYGKFDGLPGDTYARVGRFRIPFGLRQDDHTSFVRSTPFLPYDSQKSDAGLELGWVGSRDFAQLSVTDGSAPFSERAQTIAAKLGRATTWYQAGLSGFHRYSDALGQRWDRWALYASGTRGPMTLLAEAAFGTDKNPAGGKTNSEAMFAEMDYRLQRGLNLKGKLDLLDDRGGPIDPTRRYVGEVDVNPVPFAEVQLSYRYYDAPSGNSQEYIALFYFPF
ncbi:MAG TPA: hypothetical protein VK123_02865 [Candidatus Limnocylindrales bacterium]|nr:hypothetical protein [Candidatus Limnocylindrales bacterium]